MGKFIDLLNKLRLSLANNHYKQLINKEVYRILSDSVSFCGIDSQKLDWWVRIFSILPT